MIDYLSIIEKFYAPGNDDYNLLIEHSRQVADLALNLAHRHPEMNIDIDFVYEAAMLHDIGIFKTHAPSIHCHGELPYICHGYLGRELLDSLGLHKHALVCEHHTGAGLSKSNIIEQKLPLPERDMLPTTLEEKLVCYADKFFSKSKIRSAKPFEKVRNDMCKFGADTLDRFDEMASIFGTP